MASIINSEKNHLTIEVEDLVIEYPSQNGTPLRAVDKISFRVDQGKRLAFVGPSGCGKSSIIRSLAGLLKPTSGNILFGDWNPLEARKRKVFGLVPQHDALLKWRTAAGNVSLPLQLDGRKKTFRNKRVTALLDFFGLGEFVSYYPDQLSGGMRSRVSIARALALEPQVLLLDECFASLDVMTRERLYKELSPMWSKLGTTLIIITHSVPEAVYLADEVVVLSPLPGRIIEKFTVVAPQPREANFMTTEAFSVAATKTRKLLGL